MPIWNQFKPGVHWSYVYRDFRDEHWDDYLTTLQQLLVSPGPKVAIVITKESAMPTATQRKGIADLLNSIPVAQLQMVKAHAFVSDSTVARGVLTALNWVFKKPFPERTFSTPFEGLNWMTQQHPFFDPQECWADISTIVPLAARGVKPLAQSA